MKLHPDYRLVAWFALLSWATTAQAVAIVPQAVDWNTDGHSGSLGATAVSINHYDSAAPQWYGSSAGFELPFFTGPMSIGEAITISVAPGGLTSSRINFSHPVQDVHLSLLSLGSLVYIGNERGRQAQRVSGDSRFSTFCSYEIPCIHGQAYNGATPSDGNGTVLISGLSSLISLSFRSQNTLYSDAMNLQISGVSTAPLAAVPEPASALLLALGVGAVLGRRQMVRARPTR